MRKQLLCFAAWLAAGALQAETIDTGALRFTVKPDGCGFIDEVVFGGKTVASFAPPDAPRTPGFVLSPQEEARAAALRRLCDAGTFAAVPCKLSRQKTKLGHDRIILENGFVRLAVIPQVGGRIIEMTDLVTGQNHFADRYTSEDKLPDFSKRVFMGGFEDAIDRHDDAWKTPYDVSVLAESGAQLSVCFHADVENPGEGGRKLRIQRTLTLAQGRPVVQIALVYTALGGPQNVMMMPHPEPFAGAQPDESDVFYVSSHGAVVRYDVKTWLKHDLLVPLDDRDTWAAVCSRADRNTIVNTFKGPLQKLDLYIPENKDYSLEPYTRTLEQVADGQAVRMDLTYWSCYNLDAVHYAEPGFAGQLLLEKELLSRGEALAAKFGFVSAEKSEQLTVTAKVAAAGERVVREWPAFTATASVLVAVPEVKRFDLGELSEGAYTLVLGFQRPGQPAASLRAPFTRRPSRGCYVDWCVPAPDAGPARFAVSGQLNPATPVLEKIERKDEGDTYAMRLTGTLKPANPGPGARFETLLSARKGGTAIEVAHTLTASGPAVQMVREWALALPLNPAGGPRTLKTEVGNDHLFPDIWRLDNTGEFYWGWLLSGGMRWPLWRLGGLLVDSPTHYRIWKSNRTDTSATTTYEGTRAPGWLDVSDGNDWGVTVSFPDDVMKQAPKGITFNAEDKLLVIALHPGQVPLLPLKDKADPAPSPQPPPAAGRGQGEGLAVDSPVTARFRLEFHPTRHPSQFPPELTDEQYTRLLDAGKTHWSFNGNLWIAAGVPGGATKEETIQQLVHADIPPSALLRMNASFLRSIMQALGKDFVPSKTDDEDSEQNIRRVIHFYRTGEKLPPGGK